MIQDINEVEKVQRSAASLDNVDCYNTFLLELLVLCRMALCWMANIVCLSVQYKREGLGKFLKIVTS